MAKYPFYPDKGMDALMGWASFILVVVVLYGAFLEKPLTLLWHWLFPGPPHNV